MSERKQFRQLAPPERVHGVIGDLDLGGGTETVPLDAARERVLARRIDAAIDVPGFDRAALDGYAVRARDTFGASEAEPATLAVAGRVETGETPGVEVGPGRAVEVSTGAVLPREADAVARVERTDRRDGDRVAVRTAVTPGEGVMEAGADIAAGQRALGPGTRLSPRQVGLLAALGVDEVPVRRRPRVGIISTGDELIPPGDDLDHRQGEIHDVNGHTIAAGVEEAGGEPRVYPHAGDEYGEIDDLLRSAADDCDLVLSSGSTSASAADVVYRVVEERGDLLIHGVAVKPGKPMLVGTVAGTPCVGLPGYPVSALTIFRTFVAPAIREAAGLAPARTASVRGEMAVRERYAGGRLRFVPVGLVRDGDGDSLVYPVDRGSGATTSLVEADGVVEMPADTEYLAAGETVEVRLFSAGSRPPALLAVGEDDPAFSRLLDGLRRPRFLRVGSAGGVRQLRDGLPDVGVVAGPVDTDVDAGTLGGWTREWGLVVAPGNPEEIDGPGDLADRDLRFVNRSRESGLRASLDADLADVAAARGSTVEALTDAVDGYDLARRAHESPARLVAAGDADAGLGLRATATDLDLGFVSLGTQPVRILANPDRTDKEGVRALSATLPATDVLEGLAGFEPPS